MPGGRPTDYKPEYAEQVAKLCALGATDMEIADFFQVDERTITNWKHAHPEFFLSIKTAKENADARVERSLYQRATGYEQDSVKIFMPKDADKPVYAPFRERLAPDTGAAIFWLKNRQPKKWRDKIDMNLTGELSIADRVKRARERTKQ